MMRTNDRVVSLFSGAGGMSLGFSEAGAPPQLAADIDGDACRTYAENLSLDPVQIDLSQGDAGFDDHLRRHHGAFALIGGPPCQGFSSAGTKQGGDARNRLIFAYLAMIERVYPRWFLFENVEGLLTSGDGTSIRDLLREFVRLGYAVRLEKVNFASFGLPQGRKRVIVMGNRIGASFRFPDATHAYDAGKHRSASGEALAPSIFDALLGLGKTVANRDHTSPYVSPDPTTSYDRLMRAGNDRDGVELHVSVISPETAALYAKLPPGGTMKDLPSDLWHASFRRRAFRRVMDGTPTERRGGAPSGMKRLMGDLNALTITSAASREFIHPVEHRPLTLRECARLQSFPDRFRFLGPTPGIARQIGNAFPPLAASIFARHIMELDGAYGAGHVVIDDAGTRSGHLLGYRLTDASGMSPSLARTDALLQHLTTSQMALPYPPGTDAGGEGR